MFQMLRRTWVILSLVLAAFWVPASSHGLLQSLGLIHEHHAAQEGAHHHDSATSHEHEHDDDNNNNHDLADGICRTEARGVSVSAVTPHFFDAALLVMVWGLTDTLTAGFERAGPSPPGTSPPELSQVWRFSLRAALPVRAPSSFS